MNCGRRVIRIVLTINTGIRLHIALHVDAIQPSAARGTSFAAPLVAGLLANILRVPDREQAAVALRRLAAVAIDLGAPGRDPVFGIGLVGDNPPSVLAPAPADRY